MRELAIYGGTFAPIHNGHIRAAEVFLKAVDPDKLLIIPTLIPPHKQITFKDDPQHRLNMLHLAFNSHPEYEKRIFISDYEINSPPPSYTVNTLRHFSAPDSRITFLCGTDMFLTIHSWYKPEEILKLSRIAVMMRNDRTPNESFAIEQQKKFLTSKYGADVITIDDDPIAISSSEIRNGSDEIRKKYLPPLVYDYILENHLYAQ